MKRKKVRIYQLAKNLHLGSKEVLAICQQLNIPVRSHASTVTWTEAEQIRGRLASSSGSGSNGSGRWPNRSTTTVPQPAKVNPVEPQVFLNPELSWLKFNQRVLHAAQDQQTPLLERLKFLAIGCSNLDEYFMIRIPVLKQQLVTEAATLTLDGLTPLEQLTRLEQQLHPLFQAYHHHFATELRPQLAAAGLALLDYADLQPCQQVYLQTYFESQIFPVLTPLALGPGHPFPYISNLSLNLAVMVQDGITGKVQFARVKVPSVLPRFIPLPAAQPSVQWQAVPLEQVIAHNLATLFPGMEIQAAYTFRVTRSAVLTVEEDEVEDLLLAIAEKLRKRRFGAVVRLELQAGTPAWMRQTLIRELGLRPQEVYEVEGMLGLKDLMALQQLPWPDLKASAWLPGVPPRLRSLPPIVPTTTRSSNFQGQQPDMFAVLRQGDLLVHHPYDDFGATVQRWLMEAAYDPQVLTIKIILYRLVGTEAQAGSPILTSLMAAVEQGKQVVVLVELRANFDEENNIFWARKLEQAGVHVVYSVVGLKIHAKVALVVRQEAGGIRRYVHISSGNYNPCTARLYTDLGLLSCRPELGADLADLFNYLTGYSRQQTYRKLLVAPINLRDRLLQLIQREAAQHQADAPGRIIVKVNALSDPEMIMALYGAAQKGVQIDLIVRGVCCLRPQLPGLSERIRVISLIGPFLEHERIFYFHNQGQPEVWIGSADWRPRNLDQQVEVLVPVEDPAIAQSLQQLLELTLTDNRQSWELMPDGEYQRRQPAQGEVERATQKLLMAQVQGGKLWAS